MVPGSRLVGQISFCFSFFFCFLFLFYLIKVLEEDEDWRVAHARRV